MKFRSILAVAALAVFSFTACEETENLGEAKVSVSPAEVTFDATGEKSEVVALTATRDWHIENKPDWVVVNPSTGKASTGDQAVTISVDPNKKTDTNSGFDREDDIIFTIGLAKASLHVKQAGEAGEYKVEQITCAEFIQRADSLTEYRLVGKVTSSVNTTYCSFDMNDGTATVVVWTVNNKDEWKDKVKQGGTVTVRGKYTLYTDKNGNQKHEMIDAYIEDFVAGQEEDPTKVEQITCAEFIQKADPNTTYRLVGKVTSSVNATYCSFDMNDGTATVVVWTVNNKEEWKDKVKKDGTVTVRGKYLKYEKDGNVKHEMIDAYIEKFEEGTAEPEDPTKVEQITCAEFIEKADPNTTYRLVGKVTSSVNATYCSFDMNDGTATVVVWTVNNKDEWKDKVKKDGTVTVRGKYLKYEKDGNVKHEMIDAYIEKFEEGSVTPDDPTKVEQITCAEFIEKADPNTTYRLVGKVTSSVNATYCSFDINDGTATVVVWTVNNKDEWKDKVKKDGTVTVRGKYLKYESNGNVKHEMVDAYIEKFEEGQSGGPDEPELDPKGTGTLEDPFNVDGVIKYVSALAADTASEDEFYVKGKISTVTQNYTYNVTNGNTWGNARFNISDSGEAKNEFICYNCFYFGGEKFVEGQTDIKVGDEVIVVSNVVNYKGNTPEFASGKNHLYSLNGATSSETKPTFGVEKTEITVGAAATSATIKVTGNVAWTASSSDATVNPASGQGAGEITVTFAANTDTENAKTYTVVVSTTDDVAIKSYTVTITQSKASAAGDPVVVEVNFATLPSADFPSGSANGKTSGTYTFDGYEFSFNATTKFYWNTDGYVLFGKKDSYILLPSVQGKSLTSISFKTGKGASTSVMVGVSNADGSSVVKAAEKLEKQNTDYTWEIAGTVGAQYRIVVTSAHNAQFQNLVLKYE